MRPVKAPEQWGPGEAPVVRRRYVHFMTEDNQVWSKTIWAMGRDLTRVWYDVRCGTAVEVPEGSPEFLKRVSEGVTRKRIDVIAEYRGRLYVVEVKVLGSMMGVGQVFCYRDLLEREFPELRGLGGLIACEIWDEDLTEAARELRIEVYETAKGWWL